MKKCLLTTLFIGAFLYVADAQTQRVDTVFFGGKKMLRVITEKGDTAYLDQLSEVSISSKQQFPARKNTTAICDIVGMLPLYTPMLWRLCVSTMNHERPPVV